MRLLGDIAKRTLLRSFSGNSVPLTGVAVVCFIRVFQLSGFALPLKMQIQRIAICDVALSLL